MVHHHHPSTAIALCALLAIAGCGVGQAVGDSTMGAAKWAFTTQVKTMNVDLISRSAMNLSSTGQSLSTVIRIYQLRSDKSFTPLEYGQLQTGDIAALKPDLLAASDVVLRPGAQASISEPMNADAEYVGIVAFFRDGGKDAVWKLVLPKKQWKKSDPVRIEVQGSSLGLLEG